MGAIFESTFFRADASHVPDTNANRDDLTMLEKFARYPLCAAEYNILEEYVYGDATAVRLTEQEEPKIPLFLGASGERWAVSI